MRRIKSESVPCTLRLPFQTFSLLQFTLSFLPDKYPVFHLKMSIKKRTEYFHIQSFFAVTSYYTLFFVCMGCYTFPIVCIFKDILHFLNHLLHGMGHEILIYIRHLLRGNRHSLSDPYLDRKTHGSRVILRQHIGSHPRKTSVFVA